MINNIKEEFNIIKEFQKVYTKERNELGIKIGECFNKSLEQLQSKLIKLAENSSSEICQQFKDYGIEQIHLLKGKI